MFTMPISTTKTIVGTSILTATAIAIAVFLGGEKEVPKPMNMQESLAKWRVYSIEAERHRVRPKFGLFDGTKKDVKTTFDKFSITHTYAKKEGAKWDSLHDGLERVVYEDSDTMIEEIREKGHFVLNGKVFWEGPKRATITIKNKRRSR